MESLPKKYPELKIQNHSERVCGVFAKKISRAQNSKSFRTCLWSLCRKNIPSSKFKIIPNMFVESLPKKYPELKIQNHSKCVCGVFAKKISRAQNSKSFPTCLWSLCQKNIPSSKFKIIPNVFVESLPKKYPELKIQNHSERVCGVFAAKISQAQNSKSFPTCLWSLCQKNIPSSKFKIIPNMFVESLPKKLSRAQNSKSFPTCLWSLAKKNIPSSKFKIIPNMFVESLPKKYPELKIQNHSQRVCGVFAKKISQAQKLKSFQTCLWSLCQKNIPSSKFKIIPNVFVESLPKKYPELKIQNHSKCVCGVFAAKISRAQKLKSFRTCLWSLCLKNIPSSKFKIIPNVLVESLPKKYPQLKKSKSFPTCLWSLCRKNIPSSKTSNHSQHVCGVFAKKNIPSSKFKIIPNVFVESLPKKYPELNIQNHSKCMSTFILNLFLKISPTTFICNNRAFSMKKNARRLKLTNPENYATLFSRKEKRQAPMKF